VAYLRCGELFGHFTAKLLPSLLVKEFLISVNIWQSHAKWIIASHTLFTFQCPAPLKSFDILALYKLDYYYIRCQTRQVPVYDGQKLLLIVIVLVD